jgi:glycosyltransferase involved in cell wall biosynthesis
MGLTNVFESMAAARPVIVTRTSALVGEIDVEASGIGSFVEPGDVSGLARAMSQLYRESDKAKQMGLNARRLCEERFNINRFASHLHQFFERL